MNSIEKITGSKIRTSERRKSFQGDQSFPEIKNKSDAHERYIRLYTRLNNPDGSIEDIPDAPDDHNDLFNSGFGEDRKYLAQAQGRQYSRIFAAEGVIGRKFRVDKIGGNGVTLGMGSVLTEVEGPEAGNQFIATIGRGIMFDNPPQD